jgi:hypothetical protein
VCRRKGCYPTVADCEGGSISSSGPRRSSSGALAGYLYMIVLSLWVGGMSLFTFILTPVIFGSYPRDTAGEIVSRLFPSYFLFTLAVSAAALVLSFLAFPDRGSLRCRISLLLASLAVIIALYVNFRLYPEAEMVKQEVHSFEAAVPDEPARVRFRRLHAQSAVLNLFMIADGLALLIMNVGTTYRQQ